MPKPEDKISLREKLNAEHLTNDQIEDILKRINEYQIDNIKPKDVVDYQFGFVPDINSQGISLKPTNERTNGYTDACNSIGLYRNLKSDLYAVIEKIKIEHQLTMWSALCEDKLDWSNSNQKRYYIGCLSGKLIINNAYNEKRNDVYFTNESILERAIADIGEQTLITDYFNQ